MSVIVNGMDMPTSCAECPFSRASVNHVFCYWLASCPLELYEPEKKEKPEYREAEARLYIKYMNGEPVKYAFGEEWVAMALYMDDIGYDTAEAALAAWVKEQ